MTSLIVNLDELKLAELFQVGHQRLRDRIERAVRLAVPCQIDMHPTIRKNHVLIAGKAVVDHGKPLIALHIAWTLEELIQHREYGIL